MKCSHGATVGQLDQNALFYMRSRGIPESEATHVVDVRDLPTIVIELVRLDALKDRLRQLVEKKVSWRVGEMLRLSSMSLRFMRKECRYV